MGLFKMPLATSSAIDENSDAQLRIALKNMIPIPSNSEQQIILDEYKLHLTQFSVSVDRITRDVGRFFYIAN